MDKSRLRKVVLVLFLFLFLVSSLSTQEIETPGAGVEQKLVTLDVKGMNIEDVLRMIAKQTDLNIVTSKNVKGRITVRLENVPVEKALESILRTNSCVYVKEENIIKVFAYQDIQQASQFAAMITKIFSLQYARVSEIKKIVTSLKTKRGRVEADSKTNQIIVTDTIENIKKMEEIIRLLDKEIEMQIYELDYADPKEVRSKLSALIPKGEGEIFIDERTNSVAIQAVHNIIEKASALIKSWDQQPQQVFIEAKIIQVILGKTNKLGVEWEYISSKKFHNVGIEGTFPHGLTTGGTFKIGTLSKDQYEVVLETLTSTTDSKLISSPKIVVVDKKEASILIGSSEPYIVRATDQDTNVITEETRFIDVGVKLIVTPQISGQGFITMAIHPEVSSARRVAEVSNALAVDTTQADTTVIVKDGETVLLGGLIKESNVKVVNKIPFLGSIPLFGIPFRSTGEETVKTEIVVFLTPHIVATSKLEGEKTLGEISGD